MTPEMLTATRALLINAAAASAILTLPLLAWFFDSLRARRWNMALIAACALVCATMQLLTALAALLP